MSHDMLHRFWEVRGMGTVVLEDKLLQQITAMCSAVLYEVFLKLRKVYNSLDWEIFLKILAAYGVGSPQGAPVSPDVMGLYHHSDLSWRVLWPSLQGIRQSYLGRPPVPHALQCGCGCRHPPLVDGGGDKKGGHKGTWPVYMGLVGVLLCRQWTRCIDPTGEAAEGILCPCRYLLPGRTPNKYVEDGEHGITNMAHA